MKSLIENVSERNEKECKLRIIRKNFWTLGWTVVNEKMIIAWNVCCWWNESEYIVNFNEKLNEIEEYGI